MSGREFDTTARQLRKRALIELPVLPGIPMTGPVK
jgi:hypothetical protein